MTADHTPRVRSHVSEASFPLGNRLHRAAWRLTWLMLAAWTPPPLSRWRCALLRLFGANIEPGAKVYGSIRVWLPRNLHLGRDASLGPGVECYNMARISIGDRTVISQRAFLCGGTHDTSDPTFQLRALPITIGSDVWIASEAFVGPGVNVGDGCVVGARACAFSDLSAWTVYRGNPALAIKTRRWSTAPIASQAQPQNGPPSPG